MAMSSLWGDAWEGSFVRRKGYIVSSEDAGGGGRPMIGSPKKNACALTTLCARPR